MVTVAGYAAQAYFAKGSQGPNNPPSPVAWYTLHSEQGRFTVQMPAEPVEASSQEQTGLGELTTHRYESPKGSDPHYIVIYTDAPRTLADAKSILLQHITEMGFKLLTGQEIDVEGYAGYQAEYASEDGRVHGWHRLFVVENRIYEQIAGTQKATKERHAADVTKFFDSFELTP